MKRPVSLLVVALLVAGVLTKGVLWDREFATFIPNSGTLRPEMLARAKAFDGSEVTGRLVVPAYLHWLTGRQSEHDVRVNPVSKHSEWDDGGVWREMPTRTSYILD
ncbi:MAG: hypothetical protein QM790_03440 [Nibricoccus sp.]